MGLDMYLEAHRYISGYAHRGPESVQEYSQVVAIAQAQDFVTPDGPSGEIVLNVGYWRKSNQIHSWFVRECQNGVDNCQPHYVELEQLQTLRDLCVSLLTDRNEERVKELLEPQDGFFFGSTEIDEWYWNDIEHTVEQLDRILKMDARDWSFYYRSSW